MEIELQTSPLSLASNKKFGFEVFYDADSNQLVFKNWNEILGNGLKKCLIYSTGGQLVQSIFPNDNFMINTQGLPSGAYIIAIDGTNFSYKFVKP
jgi:hypothetical protein